MDENFFPTSDYKFTYYLGAGASANALPIVKKTSTNTGLSQAFIEFEDLLRVSSYISDKHKIYVDKIRSYLKWLANESNRFGTIDTYAKHLYLKREFDKLDSLKETLSVFFLSRQFVSKNIDKRPLIFLTTVMQNGEIFPTNIKIINWNYDFQIQIAGEEYRHERFTGHSHTPALVRYYPPLGGEGFCNKKELSMIHLNGIAGYYFSPTDNKNLSHFYDNRPSDFNELFDKTNDESIRNNYLLTFAWERDDTKAILIKNRIEYAKHIVKDTDVLVVVGYSFPFFNRDVDKEVFDSMKESGKLKKIYFQDPFLKGDFLKRQFELDDNIDIIPVPDCENYYIPYEL